MGLVICLVICIWLFSFLIEKLILFDFLHIIKNLNGLTGDQIKAIMKAKKKEDKESNEDIAQQRNSILPIGCNPQFSEYMVMAGAIMTLLTTMQLVNGMEEIAVLRRVKILFGFLTK